MGTHPTPKPEPESGVVPVDEPRADRGIERGCHEIIDAASTVVVNLDFLADGLPEDKRAALADVQLAITRIVKVATDIRRAVRGGAAVESSRHPRDAEPQKGSRR
jgi:hypothetical protein